MQIIKHGWIDSEAKISELLRIMGDLLREDEQNLYIVAKTAVPDKTMLFMTKYGFSHETVWEELLKLDLSNYSYTDTDKHPSYEGEVYIWGQILQPPLTEKMLTIYIKIKVRGKLICLSFHEAESPLRYPYL